MLITEKINLAELFPNSQIKIIRLKGYSNANKENDPHKKYQSAKKPFMKDWTNLNKPGLNESASDQWQRQGGWSGLVIPKGYIVIDIDNRAEAELIYRALQKDHLSFHAIKTVHGFQFIFKDTGMIKGQDSKVFMASGCVGDYRLPGRGQIVLPSENTEGRNWIKIDQGELSEMPIFFERLKKVEEVSRPFTLPINEGSRNETIYKHACRLIEFGYDHEQIHEITGFMNAHFIIPSLDYSELSRTLESAFKKQSSGRNYVGGPPTPIQPQAPSEDKPSFNLTEMGNAERLVYRNGKNLRYCIEFEDWLLWNGSTWIEDKKKRIERVAVKTFREMYAEAAKESNDLRRSELVKWAKSSEKSSIFLNSIHRAEAMLPISQSELNVDKFKLNCKNGVVDLRTGRLLPHDRHYLMTVNTNINYDPYAECPNWTRFLKSVMRNEKGVVKRELIDFLQKAIGYSLTGDISEQVIFFLWGTGRNGKSTFINTVKLILGDYGKQTNSDTFTAKANDNSINNDIARLNGSRFVSAVESEDGKKLSESLIKQLTGGEAVTARFLRKEFFEYIPEFKIFFTTNYKPIVKGDDEGIWRRIRLIPFTYTIPVEEVDKQLPEKLQKELPGILRWAVEGCLKWQQEGLGNPIEIQAATHEYKEEMDLLSNFLAECCITRPDIKIPVSELHKAYLKWADENGEFLMKQRAFNSKIQMRGFTKRKSTGNRTFFFGIGLLSEHREVTKGNQVNKDDPFSSKPSISNKNKTNVDNGSLLVTGNSFSNSVIEEDI